MPAGLLLRCALPMKPLSPPPRSGGGDRGATWPDRAGSGVARAAPAQSGSQPPVPIPPSPAEPSARRRPCRSQWYGQRGGACRDHPADPAAPSQPHPSGGDAWVIARG